MFRKKMGPTGRVKKLLSGVADLYELKKVTDGAGKDEEEMSNGQLARWTQKERVKEELGKQTAMQEARAALLLATARADAVARLKKIAEGEDQERALRASAILLRGRAARERKRGRAEEVKEGQAAEPTEKEMEAARVKWERELKGEG